MRLPSRKNMTKWVVPYPIKGGVVVETFGVVSLDTALAARVVYAT